MALSQHRWDYIHCKIAFDLAVAADDDEGNASRLHVIGEDSK